MVTTNRLNLFANNRNFADFLPKYILAEILFISLSKLPSTVY